MPSVQHITTAEQLFWHASELGRCELLRGELIMMSPAGSRHGAIAAEMAAILRDFVKPRGLGIVLGAETGFRIAQDPDTVRAPDAAFIRRDRIGAGLPQGFFPGAPDLAVEVLSPDDRANEVIAKVENWLGAGCWSVWVVDPKTHTVTVYGADRKAIVLKSTDTLTGGDLLPGLDIHVADIFAL
jgi:Uma2 family endonuclease